MTTIVIAPRAPWIAATAIAVALVFANILAGRPCFAQATKESVVVLPLRAPNTKEVPETALEKLADLLFVSLSKLSQLNVVTLRDIEVQLEREGLKDKLGCDDVKCAAEIAGALGARHVAYGKVTRLGKKLYVTLNMVDTSSSTTRRGEGELDNDEERYRAGIEGAVRDLLGMPEGPPVQVVGAAAAAPSVAAAQSGTEGMVLVPAGDFSMGCDRRVDSTCREGEKPQHTVYVEAFYIDVAEVTVEQYDACVSDGQCTTDYLAGPYCNWSKRAARGRHPINCVDWNQAQAYCAWASHKRLPTEAEWEKAACGTDGRRYPWGNVDASCALAVMREGEFGDGCRQDRTWPVCSKPGGNSPYGACDMAGNVKEWTGDWYTADYYGKSPKRSPPGAAAGSYRVYRGGGWTSFGDFLRVSYRDMRVPGGRDFSLGFCCALPAN